MIYLGIFWLEFEKNIVRFEINIFELILFQRLGQKEISLNLKQKMPDLRIFGLAFRNNIVIFKMNTLEFVYL